jgi:hypothetical protein
MKPSISVLALAIVAAVGLSPVLARPRTSPRLLNSASYDPSISGSIAVGSSLEQVRTAFGRLTNEGDGSYFSIGPDGVRTDGMAKTLRYPGFTVELDETGSDYEVKSVEVRASNLWVTPGFYVGMVADALRSLLGEPDLTAVDGGTGEIVWHYAIESPGKDLRIHLSHGVVSRIEFHGDMCSLAD